MPKSIQLVALTAALAVAVAGCASSDEFASGPQPVTDGSYVFLTSSVGGTDSATLEVSGAQLTLAQDSTKTTGTIGAAVAEAVLCPPSGTGQPFKVEGALAVGELALATPAIFGDCGTVTPRRVTVVDLDSFDETAEPFKFTRWVEFCDTTDPDCPSSTG